MSQTGLAASPEKTVANPNLGASPMKRLLSLDVVRGITIAFMIMVNNNGGPGSWRFMNHAEWNGLTPTDLVFPTFVFVVGVSVVLAIEARLAKGARKADLARHTLVRAGVLILFGIIVNSFPAFHLAHMRFYGVLQRIAICYLVVGLFYLYDQRAWTKVVALVVALVGYWVLLRWVPVPGMGVPGRDLPFMDMNRNLVSWIDQHLFPYHLYLYRPDYNVRDPEGMLSNLPAIGTALMGVLTGIWLRTGRSVGNKFAGLAIAAMGSLVLGYAWSMAFPLNKNMWTSSFVLVAGGYSLALLALAYGAVEVRGWRKGWTYVWLVFGSNAIAAYMFSELMPGILYRIPMGGGPGHHQNLIAWGTTHSFAHIPNAGWAAFAYSVSFTAFCFIPVWILYRKKIFLKV
ncbi:MAG TPA: heparan-alpha-glucosaminide N-acetyltransferase domain-containing protein [Terracidiphilus sp.]|jgi:predicted acyltransferase|nr:heparan-alpha-glucosaminide N-acetyltransferase domain-containing protein [Terracidiphilus sp.]